MKHTSAGSKGSKPDRTIGAKPNESNGNAMRPPTPKDLDRPSRKAPQVARQGSRPSRSGW